VVAVACLPVVADIRLPGVVAEQLPLLVGKYTKLYILNIPSHLFKNHTFFNDFGLLFAQCS
jgi:hypothetical protein